MPSLQAGCKDAFSIFHWQASASCSFHFAKGTLEVGKGQHKCRISFPGWCRHCIFSQPSLLIPEMLQAELHVIPHEHPASSLAASYTQASQCRACPDRRMSMAMADRHCVVDTVLFLRVRKPSLELRNAVIIYTGQCRTHQAHSGL